MTRAEKIWEAVCYLALVGMIIAQIVVGYWYLFAQGIYLVCNLASTIRSFAINQPPADKVKNCVFTAITIGLIVIRIVIGG